MSMPFAAASARSLIALALVLLVAAGLLLRSFVRLQRVELGFNPANLLTVRMALPEGRYGTPVRVAAFYQELAERVRLRPGVTSAAVASHAPLAGGIQHLDVHRWASPAGTRRGLVSPDYCATLGVRVARGRDFDSTDRASDPASVLRAE